MKQRTKKILVAFLAACITASLLAISLVSFAETPTSPKGTEYEISYSSTDLYYAFHVDEQEDWLLHEVVGFYRFGTGTQSIVLPSTTNGIGSFELTVYSEGGLGGYDYRLQNSVLWFKLFGSADSVDFVEIPIAVTAASDSNLLIKPDASIEPNTKYLKIEFFALASNNNYSLGIVNVDLFTFLEDPENVLLVDEDQYDMGTSANIVEREGEWITHESVGYYRSSVNTQSITYEIDSDDFNYLGLGDFEVTMYVDGGASVYSSFYIGNVYCMNFYAGSSIETLAKIDNSNITTTILSDTTLLKFAPNAGALEIGVKYLKIEILVFAINNNYVTGFRDIKLYGSFGQASIIPVESATIENATGASIVAGGAGLAFTGTVSPSNASFKTFSWKVYDDADCTVQSNIASFVGNVVTADHLLETNQTVYVQGTAGGVSTTPYALIVNPRPDPTAVTITDYAATMNKDDEYTLSSTVLPANANDKSVTYAVYSDSDCTVSTEIATINGDKITALAGGEVWLQATSVKVSSLKSTAVKITIKEEVLLLNDDCSTMGFLNSASDKNNLKIANDMIMRNYQVEVVPGANSDDENKVITPPHLIYKVYNDISSIQFKALVLFPTEAAAAAANNNPRVDFLYETFVSEDGIDWTFVPTTYTVTAPTTTAGGITPASYAQLTVSNKNDIPEGARYLKIVLCGVMAIDPSHPNLAGNTEEYGGIYFYCNTTPISQNANFDGYNNVDNYYNTYSPAINGVKIFAASGTIPEDAVLSVAVTNPSAQSLKKGEEFVILASEIKTSDVENAIPVDFEDYDVVVTSGSQYVDVNGNKISIKESFDGEIGSIRFKLVCKNFEVQSAEYELFLSIPVTSVTVSMDSDTINVRSSNYNVTVTIDPTNATNKTVVLSGTVVGGGNISEYVTFNANGTLRALKAGQIDIFATVDGVSSEAYRVTILEATTVTITSATAMYLGDTLTLTAVVTPSIIENYPKTWALVEGEDFATLDDDKLTATAIGVVKVSVTVDGITREISITITEAPAKPSPKGGCKSSSDAIFVFFGLAFASIMFLKKRSLTK